MDRDDIIYCAHCFVLLEPSNSEEPECQRCGATLYCRQDYLTRRELARRRHQDRIAERDAQRDGLIK